MKRHELNQDERLSLDLENSVTCVTFGSPLIQQILTEIHRIRTGRRCHTRALPPKGAAAPHGFQASHPEFLNQ